MCCFSLGFDWASLKKGSLVVDVGGGVGSTTLVLAKAFPDLRFVVQDRAMVIPDGVKVSHPSPRLTDPSSIVLQFFEIEHPSALTSGQVSFQGAVSSRSPAPFEPAIHSLMRLASSPRLLYPATP